MPSFYIDRAIDAPREILWNVITDHQLYGEAASNLSRVEVVEGRREGMKRRCYNANGEGWNETCIHWEEGIAYSFEVDTRDYPYPLSKMQGTWGISETDDEYRVYLRFDYQVKYGFIGRWLLNMFAGREVWEQTCNRILDRWEEEARIRANQASNRKREGVQHG